MLQNSLRFVLLDSFRHHVQDVVHDSSAQLQIKVRLDTLLGNSRGDAFGVTTFELPSKKIAQPSFEKWYDTTQKE